MSTQPCGHLFRSNLPPSAIPGFAFNLLGPPPTRRVKTSPAFPLHWLDYRQRVYRARAEMPPLRVDRCEETVAGERPPIT